MAEFALMPFADYKNACDAIRAKTGGVEEITSGDMAEQIQSIDSGGESVEVIPLAVNANGTYTAPEGKAYNPVTVSVSGSDSVLQQILAGTLQDFSDESSGTVYAFFLYKQPNLRNISFPNATRIHLQLGNTNFSRLSAPNVTYIPAVADVFKGVTADYIDLSSYEYGNAARNQTFYGATITTLKCGKMKSHNGMFQTAKITNLIWEVNSADGNARQQLEYSNNITNLYVPSELVEIFNGYIAAGTLTKVTNVYSIADWSE